MLVGMSAGTDPFRDATSIVAARVEALRQRRLAELAATPTGWASVYVQRSARIAFGATATLGALELAAFVLAAYEPQRCHPSRDGTGIALGLATVWLVALGAAVASAVLAARRLRRQLGADLAPTADPYRDLRRLEQHAPAAIERALAAAWPRASWVLPLVGATLLVPHTLHLAIGLLIGLALGLEHVLLDHTYYVWTIVFGGPVFAYGLWVAWQFPRQPRVEAAVRGAALVGAFPLLPVSAVMAWLTAAVVVRVAHRPMRAIVLRERALGLGERLDAPRTG